MVPFAGYEMPVQYTGVLDEVRAVRKACGLFDVSHMGQFSVKGRGALEAVQHLVTNDLQRMNVGQAQYNLLCNPQGGILDDLVVYRRSATELYLCVNASNRQLDYTWMQSQLGKDVQLEDQSEETALLALQGPRSEGILEEVADPQIVQGLKYYWAKDTTVMGRPCFLSRTGYTGEDGFEIYISREFAIELWEGLIEIGRKVGLIPAGLGARDTLRVEMGYPLHGHEISDQITPAAAGLNWVVKLDRAVPFVGQTALQDEARQGGPSRYLKGFRIGDRRIPRQGYPICLEDRRVVGEITSGTFSPTLGAPVALGFLDRDLTDARFLVEVRESFITAEVCPLPFVPSHIRKK